MHVDFFFFPLLYDLIYDQCQNFDLLKIIGCLHPITIFHRPLNTICCFLYKLHAVMQVMATICEELPPDSVVLVYLSASGSHFLFLFKV